MNTKVKGYILGAVAAAISVLLLTELQEWYESPLYPSAI